MASTARPTLFESDVRMLLAISARWMHSVLLAPADVRDLRERIRAALSACGRSGCCRLIIGRNMGESDIARQIRDDHEQWERQRDRRREQDDKRTDRFIRWFLWPMCALMGLMLLVLIYMVTPTMINA